MKMLEEVGSNLLGADEVLVRFGFGEERIKMVIFGGAAFVLKNPEYDRVTKDIDVAMVEMLREKRVREVLADFSIYGQMEGVMMPPKEMYLPRVKRLEEEVPGDWEGAFRVLEVFVASDIDLVLSKLFADRNNPQDVLDLVESGILDRVDLIQLKEDYEECIEGSVTNLGNINRLEDVLEEWERHKKSK